MRALLMAFCVVALARHSFAFSVSSTSSRPCKVVETRLLSSNDDSSELLKKAAALREEASRLEESLKSTRPYFKMSTPSSSSSSSSSNSKNPPPPMTPYKSINDSTWTLTYRFADRPESREETRTLYSGKLTVIFLNDGYTEVVRHESALAKVQKVWGWDVEQSNDDDDDVREYLLFSVDFVLPSVGKQRFYFQARKDVNGLGNISLAEGTITVKQDVVDSNASRWSLFSPRGILAEFRAVGEFIGKPSTAM